MRVLVLKLIHLYQQLPHSYPRCKFNPVCSAYSYQAIQKYGILRGSFLSLNRIIRCHPWSKGGTDPLK